MSGTSGETIIILGMTVHMDRERRRAVINHKHFLDNLISTYGVTNDSDRVTLKLGSGIGLMLGDLPLTASQFGLGWMLTVGCRLQDTHFNYDK